MYRMATQQFGLVMEDEHAKRTAEILLKQLWQRRAYGFTTTHKWLKLAPCDVATVAGKDMRIVGMTDRQGVVEFAAEAEPGGTYQSSAQAQDLTFGLVDLNASIFVPNLLALELPLIDAAVDPTLCVVYAALYGRPALYKGGMVRLSLDAGVSWTDAAAFDAVSAKVGSLEGTLGSGAHGALDYTRALTVDFADSEYVPASATDEELANGANLVAVGSGNAWEVLQFKTAALVSGYRYTLTGLLRGLYGTEWMMGAHVAGERIVLLTGRPGLQAISVPVDRIGQSLIFLAAEGERTGADQALTPAGRSLKPLAAAGVRGVRSPALDLNIAWARSDRREFVAPDLDTFEEAPQSDPPASYEVDIIHPITGGVLRTLVLGHPDCELHRRPAEHRRLPGTEGVHRLLGRSRRLAGPHQPQLQLDGALPERPAADAVQLQLERLRPGGRGQFYRPALGQDHARLQVVPQPICRGQPVRRRLLRRLPGQTGPRL